MKLFFKQLLNKFASGAANSSAHSLNNLVSIPTAPLDESEAKAFSWDSTKSSFIKFKILLEDYMELKRKKFCIILKNSI